MNVTDELHQNKELEQQKIVLKEINRLAEERLAAIKTEVTNSDIQINELEQQKIILKKLTEITSRDNASVDEVLDILSHEFRTFLVPIKAYTDMLLKNTFGELAESQKEKLRVVQENVSSLSNLVSDSIESTRLDVGEITINKMSDDINKLIIRAIVKLGNKLKENDTRIYFSDKPIIAFIDSERIFQVMIHLMENSIKSIKNDEECLIFGGGKIVIKVLEENDIILVQIEDNGTGIPKEKLSKLFSKYGKVDTSNTRKDAGIGLGLYLCKQIIEAHGGKIWIESQEKKSTSVYFTLPKNKLSK